MRRLAVLAAILAMSVGSGRADEARDLAGVYCAAVEEHREPGAELFTAGLIAAIADGRLRHDAYDHRLPITELDLDAACAVNSVAREGEATIVEIEHAVPFDSASDWYDTLVALPTPDGLRVDDIRFGTPDRTLRGALIDPSIRVLQP